MVFDKGWNRAWRVLILAVTLPLAAGSFAAAKEAGQAGEAAEAGKKEQRPQPARLSYASVSDEDLTAIAARWDALDAQQRRALLSEVKMRMKRKGTAEGVLRVNVRRRYGTVVRSPNGARATLRLEVRSVKKQGSRQFGVGFEHRAGQDEAAPGEAEPDRPVRRVADPDG